MDIANLGFNLIEWAGTVIHCAVDYLVTTPSIVHTMPQRQKCRSMKRRMFFKRIISLIQ